MTEDEFWPQLERTVTRELESRKSRRMRYLWADGFVPSGIERRNNGNWVVGTAWIGEGSKSQTNYTFALFLGQATRETANWKALLSGENTEGWLDIDPVRRALTIRLGSPAQGDGAPERA